MRDGNRQSVITQLKREIIKLLYENPDIVEMLDNPKVDPECPDTAEWVCIFPYAKIAETQQEAQTFICVTIDSPGPERNDIYKRLEINVTTFCPITIMRVPGQKGARTDILSGDISATLNWNRALGFEMRFTGEREGVLSAQEYYFRTLTFEATRENDTECGRKLR